MDKHIKALISTKDTVIIPKFGALLKTVSGKGIIMFNEHLKFNDGLLVGHVAAADGIDKDEAQKKVDEYAYKIMGDLDTGEPYSIEGLGAFFKNAKGEIQFNQYKEGDDAQPSPKVEKPAAVEVDKKVAEDKAKVDKLAKEKEAEKIKADKKAAEQKAEADKKAADEKAKAEKLDKEKAEIEAKAKKKAAEDDAKRVAAEAKTKLKEEKEAAKKADKEKAVAEKKAADDQAKADKKAEKEKKVTDKLEAEKEKKAAQAKKKADEVKAALSAETKTEDSTEDLPEVPDLTKEAALAKEIADKAKKDPEPVKNTLKEKADSKEVKKPVVAVKKENHSKPAKDTPKSEDKSVDNKKEDEKTAEKPPVAVPPVSKDEEKAATAGEKAATPPQQSTGGINPMDHVAPQAEKVDLPPASVEQQPKKKKKRLGMLVLLLVLIGLGTFAALKFDTIESWFGGEEKKASAEKAPVDKKPVIDDDSEHSDEHGDDHESDDPEVEPELVDTSNTETETDPETETEIEADPVPEVVPEPTPDPTPTPVTSQGSTGKYHLIASAFRNESNADNYVSDLKALGFSSASKLGKVNGLYQVAAGSYSSMQDAKTALSEARNKTGKGVWIMKY